MSIIAHVFDVAGVAEQCRRAAAVDVTLAADHELCQAAVALESARAALDAAQLHVLAELEIRGVCDREFGLGTASWVAERTHAPRPAMASRVKLGTTLRDGLEQVDACLSEGRIGLDHARVLADAANPRIADTVRDRQGELVDTAQRAPFPIWRRMVTELVALWDQDGGYDPAADLTRNQLHLRPVGDTTAISGELAGETALTILQVLDRETDKLWRRHQHDHEHAPELAVPPRATLRALALADICRRSQGTEPEQAPGVDLTLIAHLVDPLVDSDGAPGRPAPADTHGDAVAATVEVEVGDEAAEPQPRRAIATLVTPEGERLDPHRFAHLLCDPVFHPLLVDGHQTPLALGRAVRLANRAQRRALTARDGGCVFPGCDRPPGWCDAHHVTRFEDGGATDLPNLVLLCRHHHGVVHRAGWALLVPVDGTLAITTPAGRTLTGRRHPQLVLAA